MSKQPIKIYPKLSKNYPQVASKGALQRPSEPLGAPLDTSRISRPSWTSLCTILTPLWPPLGDPFGSLFGTCSSLGRSWDRKMVVFRGYPFWHHFFEQISIKIGCLLDIENLDNMCEGLQKSTFRPCRILDHFRYHFGGHFGAQNAP